HYTSSCTSFPTRRSSDLPQIVFQFDEDILETGRDFHSRPHRKAKAVRLVHAMVRILAENDHFDFVERGVVERGEIFDATRVDDLDRKSTRLNSSHEWISY